MSELTQSEKNLCYAKAIAELQRERDGYKELLSVLVEACEKAVNHQSEYTTFSELDRLSKVLDAMKEKQK